MNSKVIFDIEKLKKRDPSEIRKVAKQYANRNLTSKQVGLIAYHAKPALDAIQVIAKEISRTQENAQKVNAFTTEKAFYFSSESQRNTQTSEEKRDAYHHAENIHRESQASIERMNSNNNSTWKFLVAATVATGAVLAYVANKK